MFLNGNEITLPSNSFLTVPTHNWCKPDTWVNGVNDSTFILAPSAEKVLKLVKAEVQFLHDVSLSPADKELYFDIMGYNPQSLPNKMVYERNVYDSVLKVMEYGNAHYTMPPIDGLTFSLTTVQFNYPRSIELESQLGMELHCSLKNHLAIGGTYASVSFQVKESDQ